MRKRLRIYLHDCDIDRPRYLALGTGDYTCRYHPWIDVIYGNDVTALATLVGVLPADTHGDSGYTFRHFSSPAFRFRGIARSLSPFTRSGVLAQDRL